MAINPQLNTTRGAASSAHGTPAPHPKPQPVVVPMSPPQRPPTHNTAPTQPCNKPTSVDMFAVLGGSLHAGSGVRRECVLFRALRFRYEYAVYGALGQRVAVPSRHGVVQSFGTEALRVEMWWHALPGSRLLTPQHATITTTTVKQDSGTQGIVQIQVAMVCDTGCGAWHMIALQVASATACAAPCWKQPQDEAGGVHTGSQNNMCRFSNVSTRFRPNKCLLQATLQQ